MKKFLVVLFFSFSLVSTNLYAQENDVNGCLKYKDSGFNQSIRSFIGGYEFAPVSPEEEFDHFWFSTSYVLDTKVDNFLSYKNTIGIGLIGARDSSAPMIEYRLLGRITYKGFYIQGGGGLAHGFNAGDLPHLADSPLFGLISVEVGYEFGNISIGIGQEHISSPFHDDSGINVGFLAFTVKF